MVRATANGGVRAEVAVGEPVTLVVHAEMPPGAGKIISADWDLDGKGTYPVHHDDIAGTETSISRTISHTFEAPGTYFITALVHGHRDGDTKAQSRRLPNLAQVRVVVH